MPLDVQDKESGELTLADIRRYSRYLRTTYGAAAISEAERRIAAHGREARHEVADIWRLVLMHLRGSEVTDDTHRILRAKRKLKVKTDAA
jgi:hypothetical protein